MAAFFLATPKRNDNVYTFRYNRCHTRSMP